MQTMPRPKDTQRKIATSKKSTPINEVPSPDDYKLCEHGKRYWETHAPQLVEANILTPLHIETFADLCRCYGEYRRLSDWIAEDPNRAMFITDKGYAMESPQLRMRDRAFANVQKLWPKFGLHPLSLAQMRKHGGISTRKASTVADFARGKYGPTTANGLDSE